MKTVEERLTEIEERLTKLERRSQQLDFHIDDHGIVESIRQGVEQAILSHKISYPPDH